jgi:sugar transferase EpsL
VYYVDNCSFVLDLIILIKTIEKVFISEGINQVGQATAEKFTGTAGQELIDKRSL